METIIQLLQRICTQLDNNKIPYMVSGSVAMMEYTLPRMTRDIDLVVNLQLSDLEIFLNIFKEGFYIHPSSVKEEILRRGMFNVIDFQTSLKIDFIVRKNTEFNINEFNRRKKTTGFGFETWVVSIEDLVVSKISWIQQFQSDTQINDIKNLLENPDIDLSYIQQWCEKLKFNTFNLIKNA